VPVQAANEIRNKLYSIKQRGTVAQYNAAFRRLSMQIDMDFQEARFIYLKGLTPNIRDLVRTKDNLTDIRELQLACLQLDDHEKSTAIDNARDSDALVANTTFLRAKATESNSNDEAPPLM